MDYMKRNKYIYGVMAAGLLLAASCTDFDDYNKAYTDAEPGSTQTLWDNISQRGNLSQFASLLQKGGYDTELQNSRFYTVWAPEDGTFNYDSVNALGKDALVKFIRNFLNPIVYHFVGFLDIDESGLDKRRIFLQSRKPTLDICSRITLDVLLHAVLGSG